MELDFYKTYNNVRFQKWERFCYNEKDKDKFIADIKHENPEVIIVKEEKESRLLQGWRYSSNYNWCTDHRRYS